MQRAEPQKANVQSQPAARQGGVLAVASPQGEQIAQLESMVEFSPLAVRQSAMAERMNASTDQSIQRKLAAMIHNSPRQTSQRKVIDGIHRSPYALAQMKSVDGIQSGSRLGAQSKLFDGTADTAQRMNGQEPLQAKLDVDGAIDDTESVQGKFTAEASVQREQRADTKRNNTGMPDNLKSGIESLSGMSMDHVKVHYNSSQPAQLNALAYAQGSDIHVGPGQEKHLPHEAWHVVQQAQGRVRPTMQMKDGVPVNDDNGLEHEADVMGAKAANVGASAGLAQTRSYAAPSFSHAIQRLVAPPAAAPAAGVRGRTLNGAGVPTESHVTTPIAGNDLVGTVPGAIINGWPYIQGVNATGAWVRFHLVNQQIGGLGDQNNLVPTSHATNHNAGWRAFEVACQAEVNRPNAIHVSVDVAYPAAVAGAVAGTLAASQHFYPISINAACHRWSAVAGAWVQHSTANVLPFPLQPPAAAGRANLRQQTEGWLRNTLMGGAITAGQAHILATALDGTYMGEGEDIDALVAASAEPTPEMQLMDAIETFVAVEFNVNNLPAVSRVNVYNGVYHLP